MELTTAQTGLYREWMPKCSPTHATPRAAIFHIAYQVFGDGPVNLVIAPPFVSNVEIFWERPEFSRWLLRIASYARVAIFDKRGTGMSDRVSGLPGLDQRIDDLGTG